ncbi:MAG: tetratricopeptide repeat protein [Candidatus Sumerlaeia bacterium]
MASHHTVTRREWLLLGAILLAAAALRVSYLRELIADRAMLVPVVDAIFHDYWARALVTGNWTPAGGFGDPMIPLHPFAKPPGYAYFMAAIYAVSGCRILAVVVAQMALGLLNVAMTWWLGRWIAGRAAGLVAAAIMGLYWVLVYFEGELLDPALAIALTLLLALSIKRWLARPRLPAALLAGLLIGILSLVRSNFVPLAPLVALGAWISGRRRIPGAWSHAALVLVGAAAAIAPVTLRNWRAGGELVLISANSGINLLIGNNPRADLESPHLPGVGELLHKSGWSHFDDLAIVRGVERKLGRPVGYGGASRYFTAQALAFMRDHPGRALSLTAERAVKMLGPVEYSNNKVIALERDASPLLRVLPGNFTILFVLAMGGVLCGALLRGRRGFARTPNKRAFVVFMVVYIVLLHASYVLFFLEARFRIPMTPFLAILAAACIVALARLAAARDWAPLAGGVAAMGCLYGLLCWPAAGYRPDRVYWHQLRATQYSAAGDPRRCGEELEKAYGLDNRRPSVALALGQAYLQEGKFAPAAAMFQRAVNLMPESFDANLYLGYTLLEVGNPARAERFLAKAARLDPANETARQGLATAMKLRGAAPGEIQRALREAGAR